MGFRAEILKRIEKAVDLPTLPGIFTKISSLLNSTGSSAKDIADIMKDDPALTARLLKVTNSAAFGGSEPISSVTQAVARLGFVKMGEIARSLSVLKLFTGGEVVDYREFWRHSLSVASATSLIPRHLGKGADAPEELFTAGLLHDIGIFVLEQYTGDLYRSVASMARETGQPLNAAEQQLMQIDHAEVGCILLKKWHIPESIAEAVRTHHEPYRHSDSHLFQTSELVKQANFICTTQGATNGISAPLTACSNEDWIRHGFTPDDVPSLLSKVARVLEDSSTMLAASSD